MKQTFSYTELINILEAARLTYKTWYKNFSQSKDAEMIEKIMDLKFEIYASNASYFEITDSNPF